MNQQDELAAQLATVLRGVDAIENLRRLSGGASQETWSFDAIRGGQPTPLIFRRAVGRSEDGVSVSAKFPLESEAELVERVHKATPLVPHVHYVAQPADAMGHGYIMDRIAGETIARKILREEAYASARPKLARQCGEVLARIHRVSPKGIEGLPHSPPREQLDQYRATYDRYDYPHPVFELAFQWLESRMVEAPECTLVHGDFRNGNIVVNEDGLAAVIDWELAHTGDPMEDLGWICVNSWRYGELAKPVGGFGQREELFEGYASAGGTVDAGRVRFWEAFGSLKWGVMCMSMCDMFRHGADRSVERAAIGRRSSETEIDLLNLIANA